MIRQKCKKRPSNCFLNQITAIKGLFPNNSKIKLILFIRLFLFVDNVDDIQCIISLNYYINRVISHTFSLFIIINVVQKKSEWMASH